MSWVAVAAAAAVASTAITGYSAYTANKTAEKQAQADANAAAAQGRLEAERIRKQKEKVQSAARAAAAGNGLDVKEGTTVVINDNIEQAANYDANMAEITGFNSSQRLQAEASQYGRNATMAAVSGVTNTVAAGASGYTMLSKKPATTQTNSGWK